MSSLGARIRMIFASLGGQPAELRRKDESLYPVVRAPGIGPPANVSRGDGRERFRKAGLRGPGCRRRIGMNRAAVACVLIIAAFPAN